jgi:hypothetical protein
VQVVDAAVLQVALDRGGQADALAVRLEGARAGLVRVGLGGLAPGGGGRGAQAPVVEHVGHVEHLARPLGDPEHEVPVLRALEVGVEPTDLVDERAPQHAEVARVHLGAQPLG